MTDKTNASTDTADREIVTTRLINAPRELIFEAWTNPKHVVHWWGPNGFTNTIHEMDVRPGGVWRFMMHGPDGVDYPNKIVYIEVVKPKRLVYAHSSDDDKSDINFHTTVTFDDVDGKTNVTMRAVFVTAEMRDKVIREHGAVEGAKQHLGRLEEYVSKM